MNKYALSLALGAIALCLPLAPASASVETVIHAFTGGADGGNPAGGLAGDSAGNGYGTTAQGGAYGAGTVYKITPHGVLTTIHSFGSGLDGANPQGTLILGHDGSFYGTTNSGGANGVGTFYKITPPGQESVLYSFGANATDGGTPFSGLIQATDGNFYGTTYYGGATPRSAGTVYCVTPAGQETILHSFYDGANDGGYPIAGVIQARDGKLYGTTVFGGSGEHGVIYSLTLQGQEAILHIFFGGPNDGADPEAGLIQAKDGHFYGTTDDGGAFGYGTVYTLGAFNRVSLLYSFTGGPDGTFPNTSLLQGLDGNFYGTTPSGGAGGDGTVYRVTPGGQETLVHSFTGGTDGNHPDASLVQTQNGYLFGTTYFGGHADQGTLYRIIL